MGWDCEFFLPKNSVFRREPESGKKSKPANRFVHCVECNELIGVVSTTLYEIEDKHYCSKCYSRKIITLAVERDHFDLKKERALLKK